MHDVFISYSSYNREIADAICHYLEESGIKCWYAPRDIREGDTWASAIVHAIAEAKVFVLVFSEKSNQSEHVLREVTNAADSDCVILPFRVDQTVMSDDLSYYLKSVHWLDAMSPPLEEGIRRLCGRVQRILSAEESVQESPAADAVSRKEKQPPAKKSGKRKAVPVWVSLLLLGLLFFGVWFASWLDGLPAFRKNRFPSSDEGSITASREDTDTVQTMHMFELSGVEGYSYPFFSHSMFTQERDMYFVQDEESGTLSLVKTDTGYRTVRDLELPFSDPKKMFVFASSTADYFYFVDMAENCVRIYDRDGEKWITEKAIALSLADTELIADGLYNVADMTSDMDKKDDFALLIYDTEKACLTKMIYMFPDGTFSTYDLSRYGLVSFAAGIDRTDRRCALFLTEKDQLKVLDIECGEVLDTDHETLLTEYLPYAVSSAHTVSPGGQYLRICKQRDNYGEEIVWDLKTGRKVFSKNFSQNYNAVFSSENQILYFNCEDYTLTGCDLTDGRTAVLLEKPFFADREVFPDYPHAFLYSSHLNACFFVSSGWSEEDDDWIIRLTMTDTAGNVLAQSDAMYVPFALYFPVLYEEEGIVLLALIDAGYQNLPADAVSTVLYRALYTRDRDGNILFTAP